MSVLAATRAALVAAIDTELPTVQVTPHPPADMQAIRESVWLERAESTFDWRSLGIGSQLLKNRTEDIAIELRCEVLREGKSQSGAAADAVSRCEELWAEVEQAIALDPSLSDTVSYGRLASISVNPTPTDSGWVAVGTARFEATNHP